MCQEFIEWVLSAEIWQSGKRWNSEFWWQHSFLRFWYFFSYHNTTLCDGGVRLFIVAFSWREAKANHPHLSIALVPKRHHLSNFSFGCRTTTAFHIILPYKDKDVRKRIRKSKNNTNMVSPTFLQERAMVISRNVRSIHQ